MVNPAIKSAIDYYSDPVVSRALLSCWGCPTEECPDVALPDPAAARCLERCTVAYLAVSSTRIAAKKQGIPVKSIRRWTLPAQFQKELRAGDGALEISQPLGYFHPPPALAEKPLAEQVPERTFLFLDFEAFNREDPTWAFKSPRRAFELLEGMYRTLTSYFAANGINALVTMSGRGYHIVSCVAHAAPAMSRLIELGYSLSPEVRYFLDHPWSGSKRDAPIPWNLERAYWGARQLEHYVYTETIGPTRAKSEVPVEMSDRGGYGISFDATSMNRTVETGGFGSPAAIYTKPQVRYHFGGRFPTRTVRAVVLNGTVHEYADLEQMLKVREDYREAVANATWWLKLSPGGVPDGSAGVERLIDRYNESALADFHAVMNQHYRLDRAEWQALVTDLGRAALEDPLIGQATARPNPALLEPDLLNDFLFALYRRWQPAHGLHAFKRAEFVLSGFYYNESSLLRQFNYEAIDWGKTFNHEVPQRHAQAWVTILGGQLFEF